MFSDHLKTCPDCRAMLYLELAEADQYRYQRTKGASSRNVPTSTKIPILSKQEKLKELDKLVKDYLR